MAGRDDRGEAEKGEKKLLIVAGETSGDQHGAHLLSALKERDPTVEVWSVGGEKLRRAGARQIVGIEKLSVIGLLEVLKKAGVILSAFRAVLRKVDEEKIRTAVLIDFPDFNLRLAKALKKRGVRVLYYISPQVWAWRSGRVKTIKKLVDRMAVILPFEQDFYRKFGMAVDFVGHPLLDSVQTTQTREDFLQSLGIASESTVIGILPGSRKREIAGMLPVFLAAAKLMQEQLVKPVFVLPLAPTLTEDDLLANGLADAGVEVRVVRENRYELMAACKAVMAASGTVSLELAILNVPMVISYRVSPLTYFLGRRLIKVQYASLVNLVAGREVAPELLQHEAVPEKIARATVRLVADQAKRANLLAGLAEVRQKLGGAGASAKAARLALETVRKSE